MIKRLAILILVACILAHYSYAPVISFPRDALAVHMGETASYSITADNTIGDMVAVNFTHSSNMTGSTAKIGVAGLFLNTVTGTNESSSASHSHTGVLGRVIDTSIYDNASGAVSSFGSANTSQFTGTITSLDSYSSYGSFNQGIGNLGTDGDMVHYGSYNAAVGTADINYGVYGTASDATTNYAGWFDGVVGITGIGDGGLTNYDLKVGDVDGSPTYGMIQMGNSVIGRTSYNLGDVDLDGAILVRNIAGPVTSEIEFVWTESTGDTCRFALPKSAVGNATYNSRSMILAGPAPADTDFVKVSYWQGQGIFDNLTCDTSGTGADLGVQNDLEIEGTIFTDHIKESTSGSGVAIGDGSGNDLIVEADGDSYWKGGGGLPFGSVYGNEINWTQANAVQNTWYKISDADMTTGQLHNVTHDGNGQLTVTEPGMYHAVWSCSSEIDAASKHVQITFCVNGTETNDGMNHYESFGVSRQFPIPGNAILDLPDNATVEVSIRTTDVGTPNLLVDHLNITLFQIGGT